MREDEQGMLQSQFPDIITDSSSRRPITRPRTSSEKVVRIIVSYTDYVNLTCGASWRPALCR